MKPQKKIVYPPINKYTKEYKTLIRKYKMNIVYYLPGELYDKLINHYEKLIDDFASTLYKNNKISKSFKCKIFLVNKDDVNANCIKSRIDDSMYYIGLNFGLIEELIEHSTYKYKSSCFKNTLDEYENSSQRIYFDVMDLQDIKFNPAKALRVNIMLSYIIFHEVGHILCGHCEPSEKEKLTGKYHFSDNYLYQAEEYMADYFAVVSAFSYLRHMEKQMDCTQISTYFAASIIEYWKTILSNERSISFYFGKEIDHPHSLVRMKYMCKWIKSEMCSCELIKTDIRQIIRNYNKEQKRIHKNTKQKIAKLDLSEEDKKKIKERKIDYIIPCEILEIIYIKNRLVPILELYENLNFMQ